MPIIVGWWKGSSYDPSTKRAIPVVGRVHWRKLAADESQRATRAFFHVVRYAITRENFGLETPRDIDRWFAG